jgi:magnesium chelatase family protein
MQINIQALKTEELIKPNQTAGQESIKIKENVREAHHRQWSRQGCINAFLSAKDCERVSALGNKEQVFLQEALSRLKLSGRGYHRLLKVARTIADMRKSDTTQLSDLQQALSFKQTLQAPL